MSKQSGRRNQNRPPKKKPAARIERVAAEESTAQENELNFKPEFISLTWDPIHYLGRLIGATPDRASDKVVVDFMPIEDTIHPVKLNFPIPLVDKALDPKGFRFHWEKLTYAFQLPDPAQFPPVTIEPEEQRVVARFIQTCLQLAQYTVLNGSGGISINSNEGEWSVSANFPSHQEFVGLSGTFRQLHNPPDEASYSSVKRIIDAAAGRLEGDDLERARDLSRVWDKTRKALLKKMMSTIVCEKVLGDLIEPDEPRVSMYGVNPDEIIKAYNYGDSLHWGSGRETLQRLHQDEYTEAFHKHCCIEAMITLSHFYFGYAMLAAAALGMRVNAPAA
ncbi:hypothetical protein [Rhodococcoides fascians]|uniref:hypothetical protein n=1 Tax=Rhodococcoides fascians TaxID=1828 RepID=UPI001D788088|nr:hypothetical protein [Rhodococcus fascians]CAH0189921.1 hypothetical protein SRABI91_01647 [Rhodococcus fascians]